MTIMNISLSKEEKQKFEEDARFMGMSLSEFVRSIRRYWKKEKTKDIPLYRNAVKWIAINDEPKELNLQEVSLLLSVALVADLYGTSEKQVAEDVVVLRRQIK